MTATPHVQGHATKLTRFQQMPDHPAEAVINSTCLYLLVALGERGTLSCELTKNSNDPKISCVKYSS